MLNGEAPEGAVVLNGEAREEAGVLNGEAPKPKEFVVLVG